MTPRFRIPAVLFLGMYENVLIPTDGSERGQVAMAEALVIASKYDATVHAVPRPATDDT